MSYCCASCSFECSSCCHKPAMSSHPVKSNCCFSCDRMQHIDPLNLSSTSKDKLLSQGSACEFEMSNPQSERNMKNYLHDNPQFEETEVKKSSSAASMIDCLSPNSEIWILQCPKNFDPKTIMNTELGNLQKDKSCKVDMTTKCFNSKITLACLTPEKAAEYEAVCDHVKMLRPVGKITVVQKANLPRKSSNPNLPSIVKLPAPIKCEPQSDADDCSDVEPCEIPITSKKVKAKINEQKFTIETTVTVENCGGDRKKNRKSRNQESCGSDCLPLVPPESIVPKKKQKKICSDDEDMSWLKC
ncbi:hypothetical protein ACKWTF_013156 [Chironomus riparius]